ncbi:MAG: T9SS type A sorting domain-containing protein [Bacteroidia bacterium]|nr:T9SS type A sorting domain-containing protein [Bacteroidia bacterium]
MKTIYYCLNAKFRTAMLMVILTTNIFIVKSQNITNYSFSATAGTYTPLVGATVVPLSGGTVDDGYYNNLPIGFTFTYMGVPSTTFSASTNGWMTLGQNITVSGNANLLTTGGSPRPVIAPLWDDIDMVVGTLSYQTSGLAGNRILTVEWLNEAWNYTATSGVISFQSKLYESTGVVEFIYRQEAGAVLAGTASIGITALATGAGNYLSLNNSGTSPIVSSTTATTSISTKPADGQTYTFTPAAAPSAPGSLAITPVGMTTMTVSWLDNSISESGFYVYRSLDNVNFNLVGTIPTTTSTTTGTSYSLNQIGLTANTQYYYNIVSFNEAFLSIAINGNATTLPATFCGNRTVGPTGNYLSLTAAFADIALNGLQCSSTLELQAAYVSTVETFPITIPFFGNNSTTTLTVRPEVGATNLSIISDSLQTLNLNGTVALVFDGRAGGVGSSALTIGNTRISGAAISFINGASYNNFHDLLIKGVNTSVTGGVITFLTSTSATGNNYNTFQNNNISDGATTPTNLIYSAGSVSAPNTGNAVLNNNLFNFFSPTLTTAAVSVAVNNSAWTISNNRVYQEVARTYTTGTIHYGIRVVSSTGINFTINNNTVGYSSMSATGVYIMDGTVATRFSAISLTADEAGPSNIQGNIINNISLKTANTSSTTTGVFSGIAVLGGSVNIGTTSPNLIGSGIANDVIAITSTVSAGALVGIYTTSSGTMNISNNKIGGFSASGAATIGNTIRVINTAGSGSYTISGNEIGSLTLADNMRTGIMGTTTASTDVTGIENTSSGTSLISGNKIYNLSSFGTGTAGQIRGISSTAGISTISNNEISYLTTAGGATGTTITTASVIGISKSGTTANQSVSGNTISNLSNISVAAAVSVNGICYTGATTGSNLVSKNTIRNLSAVTTGLGLLNGINISGGFSTFANNMISLGLDAAGASVALGNLSLSGIRLGTTAKNNFYFNSVHITGSNVTTGTASSQGFIRTAVDSVEIKNNIFVNTRSNSTGSGKHYAINLNLATTVTAGNNDYYFPNGMMGVVATTDYPLLGNWKIGTGLDVSSIKVDPMFISATDLHINNSTASSLESGGVVIAGVSTDFDGDSRPGPAGSINGGGTKPDIGADEFDGIPINLDMGATVLVSPLTTGCYGTAETVRVRIKNYAGAAMDFSSNPITVNVQVTGPNPIVFTPVDIYSGTLASGATLDTTISTTYNMIVAGQYIFKASTVLAGDANNGNDSMSLVTVNVSGGNANASALDICNGRSTTLMLSGYNGTIQWQNSIDGGTVWNNETDPLSTAASYVVSPVSNIKYRAFVCGLHPSDTLDINVITTPGPITLGETRCGPGPVTLSATGTGTLLWYDASIGGNRVNTGSSFSTSISANTSYYVSDVAGGVSERVGKTNQGTSSFISTLKYGVLFTVNTPARIDSVHVYPTGTGTVTIQILDPSTQAVLYSAVPFSLSGTGTQKIAVPVAISLIPGNYKMSMSYTGITNIVRTTSGGPFPYTSPSGAVSITSGATGTATSTSYYWFYDWVITTGCESLRTQVTATMTAPPAMSISTTDALLCYGDSTTIAISSGNPYTYTWSPAGSLNTTTGTSVVAKPTVTTKYFVNAVDGSSCANVDSITIVVKELPTLTLASSPSIICFGNSSQIAGRSMHLGSALLDENFNVAPTNWTITNTSNPAGLQWAFVTSFGVNTMNGTPFAFVDSDSPGSGTIVNSVLTGPVVNTTGYDSLVLSFDQYYRNSTSTIATVEVFNGTTWVQIYKPTATIGSWTTSNIRNINITQYSNANLQIRFSYFGDYDWSWAIDNVKISTYMKNDFNWTGNGLSATHISNPIATPAVTTMYNVTVTDPSTTCSMKDSIEITVNSNPIVNLGVDTAICSNLSLTLDAGLNYTAYVWSTTATTQTVTVNTAAVYSVTVTDANGCNGTDAINVAINTAPVISLGVDSIICDGQTVALTPGIGFTEYNWSTGATTSVVAAMSADDYSVIVTDVNQCKGYDTVTITVNALPVVSLGADIAFCQNDSGVLDAGAGFVSYSWSNSTSLQTTTVSTEGTYSVTVTDNNGCSNSDAITVVVNALPVIDLGVDQTFCLYDSYTLDAGNGFITYAWSDNSTSQTLTVMTAGTYSVTVTDNNSCSNSDAIVVIVNVLPVVDLGSNISFCMNDSAILDAGNGFYSYSWSDNSTLQTLTVSTAGTYSVTVTDVNGCNNFDALSVVVNALPVISLGPDTVICKNEEFVLDAGSGFSSYLWDNSATTQSVIVDGDVLAAGDYSYSVIVSGSNGCEATDTVIVKVDLCAGINEENEVAVFSLYPNPSQGEFTITTTSSSKNDIVIEVADIEGRVIYKEKISQFTSKTIQLNNAAPGIYFVKIQDAGNNRIQKLIIN